MHLTFDIKMLAFLDGRGDISEWKEIQDIDEHIFCSIPSSQFILDERIPKIIRELISEAEQSIKMNLLTGASACTRKAIYELCLLQKAEGKNYEEKIKSLKKKFPNIDEVYFDVLAHIQDMTSEKVHEQSWDKWDNKHLTLFLGTLKNILQEIYVFPDVTKKSAEEIQKLLVSVKGKNKSEAVPITTES